MANAPEPGEWTDVSLKLTLLGHEVPVQARIPISAVRVQDVLPALYALADAIVVFTTRLVEAQGKMISCGAGCCHCCRAPVPIAPAEALYLAELVESMPPPRRTAIQQRFEAAVEHLREAGLLDELVSQMDTGHPSVGPELTAAVQERWVRCPFLEEHLCSIYPHRPAVCREHLVTSPPSHCAETEQKIVRVLLPARVSRALFHFWGGVGQDTPRAVPLVTALRSTGCLGDRETRLSGKQLFEGFLRKFSASELGRELP
jgi:Fe-S-cluster containining protein